MNKSERAKTALLKMFHDRFSRLLDEYADAYTQDRLLEEGRLYTETGWRVTPDEVESETEQIEGILNHEFWGFGVINAQVADGLLAEFAEAYYEENCPRSEYNPEDDFYD